MKTALIADDSPHIRSALRTVLANAGIDVRGEAANGIQAIELAKSLKPDVVLLDISMPVLSGAHAALQMKQIVPGPRIIVLTFHGEDAGAALAKTLGVDAVLSKSAGAAALNEALRTVLQLPEHSEPRPAAAV